MVRHTALKPKASTHPYLLKILESSSNHVGGIFATMKALGLRAECRTMGPNLMFHSENLNNIA